MASRGANVTVTVFTPRVCPTLGRTRTPTPGLLNARCLRPLEPPVFLLLVSANAASGRRRQAVRRRRVNPMTRLQSRRPGTGGSPRVVVHRRWARRRRPPRTPRRRTRSSAPRTGSGEPRASRRAGTPSPPSARRHAHATHAPARSSAVTPPPAQTRCHPPRSSGGVGSFASAASRLRVVHADVREQDAVVTKHDVPVTLRPTIVRGADRRQAGALVEAAGSSTRT